jgi:hypothetical protein
MTFRAPAEWNSEDDVNPTLGTVDGKITLTMVTNDQGNFGAEDPLEPKSDTDTLQITVNSVNDDPTANDDYSSQEPLLILKDSAANEIDALVNDTFIPDVAETLNITSAQVTEGHGSATTDGAKVFYTPAGNTEGPATIEYTISDGNGGTSTAKIYVDTVDFVPADFSGSVYVDGNGNGVKDEGEVGISGVLIRLTGTSIQGTDLDLKVLTDENGEYRFKDVMPSADGEQYVIQQMQPGAYQDGAESHEAYVGTDGNDRFTFALDRFGLKEDEQGNVIQSGENNNFGELGLTVENFQFSVVRDLFHSDGGYDPNDENTGGIFFSFGADGNLQAYMNLGGWDNVIPGWQVDDDAPYDVTLNGNTVRFTNTADGQTYNVSVDPGSYRMMTKLNADGSTVVQIIGHSDASGITWNQVTQAAPAAEGEADEVIEMMTGQGGSQQYVDDVDAIFGDAGMMA